jgi:hypothetical protein
MLISLCYSSRAARTSALSGTSALSNGVANSAGEFIGDIEINERKTAASSTAAERMFHSVNTAEYYLHPWASKISLANK